MVVSKQCPHIVMCLASNVTGMKVNRYAVVLASKLLEAREEPLFAFVKWGRLKETHEFCYHSPFL